MTDQVPLESIQSAIQTFTEGHSTVALLAAVSCHSADDVRRAESRSANFAVLGPIFGKQVPPPILPIGLGALRIASQGRLPVFALGGVTEENAEACREAGAAGVAAIRLFQQNNIHQIVSQLSLR